MSTTKITVNMSPEVSERLKRTLRNLGVSIKDLGGSIETSKLSFEKLTNALARESYTTYQVREPENPIVENMPRRMKRMGLTPPEPEDSGKTSIVAEALLQRRLAMLEKNRIRKKQRLPPVLSPEETVAKAEQVQPKRRIVIKPRRNRK